MSTVARKLRIGVGVAVAIGGLMAAGIAAAEVDQGSIARGGKLYDKWYKVVKAEAPADSHPLYPAEAKYADKPDANWRCKECHGWDGLGAEGAYKSGKHATGIKGINGMAGGDPAAVVALLKAPEHGYGDKLSDADMMDLANFVVSGPIDLAPLVDLETKASKGDAEAGKQVFNTVCAGCHGPDGKLPKDMPPLGSLVGNPQEVLHKLFNGQPGEVMPALRALDHSVAADVLAHLATLPKE